MEKRDNAYIRHILDCIAEVEKFVKDVSREDFFNNTMLQGAVIYQLLIIGEAARALSQEFKDAHSGVPWKLIVGMRNKLIHEYMATDVEIVWEAIQKDLTMLKESLTDNCF